MPGFMPGIHVLNVRNGLKAWMAGTKPGHDVTRGARRDKKVSLAGSFFMMACFPDATQREAVRR
jgi:hypothetical protein